jgi:GDP-4-dehydro-6-deoxy-D-mannose reductase
VQKMLVTGAEGFAGSCFYKTAQAAGYDVVGGVWNRARKLAFERTGGKALVCDVSDAINVARVVASVQPNVIVHLAGLAGGNLAFEEPLLAYQSTVTAWVNVLDAARRATPRARILLVSGADVYGTTHATGKPVAESASLCPDSTFGSLKSAAESIAATFHRDYHLDVMIARPFNYVGANAPEDQFWGDAARRYCGQPGNPAFSGLPGADAGFDLLDVTDVAQAYLTLIRQGTPNTTYNVCSGTLTPFGTLWTNPAASAGANNSSREFVGPIPNLCGDNSRLKALGWSPMGNVQQAWKAAVDSVAAATASARA